MKCVMDGRAAPDPRWLAVFYTTTLASGWEQHMWLSTQTSNKTPGRRNLYWEQIWPGWMGWMCRRTQCGLKLDKNGSHKKPDPLLLFWGQNTQDLLYIFPWENVQLTADYGNHHMEVVHKAPSAIYRTLSSSHVLHQKLPAGSDDGP